MEVNSPPDPEKRNEKRTRSGEEEASRQERSTGTEKGAGAEKFRVGVWLALRGRVPGEALAERVVSVGRGPIKDREIVLEAEGAFLE